MIHGQTTESLEKKLDLSAHDSEAINQLILYSYSFKYEPAPHTRGDTRAMKLHLRVAMVADMYLMPELSNKAYSRFKVVDEVYSRYEECADAIKELYTIENVHDRFSEAINAITEEHYPGLAVHAQHFASL